MTDESMQYDVVIVGAGPAGLASAIRFAQLCREHNKDFTICVLEKGADIGAHILSGAILEPTALNELLPDWSDDHNKPPMTAVTADHFYYLTDQKKITLPTPKTMKNDGNYIISLGQLCQWLGQIAEEIGVEIFPGFAAKNCLFDEKNQVIGVQTGDMGLDKNSQPKSTYQPGVKIQATYTLLGEGCRGHLSQELINRYQLNQTSQPQTYGIGIKELWEVPETNHHAGTVIHTVGWPLDKKTYGGSFIYHMAPNLISLGFVIGLDYQNPYLNPFQELQRFKHHPAIAPIFKQGRCIRYGARALNEGGWQSIPTLCFPGGMLMGCAAGFLNVAKIKGIHNAMKSGILAAETTFQALCENKPSVVTQYAEAIQNSSIKQELYSVRNIRPSFQWGLWPGLIYSAIDQYCLFGKTPWTLKNHLDHKQIKPSKHYQPIQYPKADGMLSFDKLTALSRANVYHEEDQPCHLLVSDKSIPIKVNYNRYAGLEGRYCPAGVYEFIEESGTPRLQINAQNCIHCKTCDIKDPGQNIRWTTPEGGGGPNYSMM